MEKEYLIEQWINGALNEEENQAFDALEDARFYETIVADASKFKASNFSKVSDFDTFKKHLYKEDKKVKKLNWVKPIMRIASVMVLAFGLYYFLMGTSTNFTTGTGEMASVILPDESEVRLNAQSEITFNKRNWNSVREVNLKGEAFFKVAKGQKFDVVTKDGTVSVLGTQFNVKQREGYFEVLCYEGVVQVVSGETTSILKVGDQLRFTNGTRLENKHSEEAPKWVQNISSFDSVALNQVFPELERQFGVQINTEKIDPKVLFTGSFLHNNIEEALKAVCGPLDLTYKVESDSQIVIQNK